MGLANADAASNDNGGCNEKIRELRGQRLVGQHPPSRRRRHWRRGPRRKAFAFGVEGQIEIADLIFGHGPDGKAVAMGKPRGTELEVLTVGKDTVWSEPF